MPASLARTHRHTPYGKGTRMVGFTGHSFTCCEHKDPGREWRASDGDLGAPLCGPEGRLAWQGFEMG